MANNQILTSQLISNTALAEFSIAAPYIQTASRMYQSDFTQSGYKCGDSILVRRQNQFIVGDGSVATTQSIVETVEKIDINHQYHVLISYTIADLSLRIEDFSRMFIRPAVQNIIAKMEVGIGLAAEQSLNFYQGTAGTPINSFMSVDLCGAKLLEQAVDINDDAYLAMSIRDSSTLKAGLQNQFTSMMNEKIAARSAIGHLSYFDMFQSQNIANHVGGAGPRLHPNDSLTVNGAVSSGSTIVLAGATASIDNYFLPGDLISISGVSSINPVSFLSTGQDMQFLITAAASSSGGGAITIQVSPSIVSATGNTLQNVSNAIPSGGVVTTVGSHKVNVAYPTRGLDIVCPPLYKLQVPFSSVSFDPETGLAMALSQTGDINSYENFMRLDLLCGYKWHPQYAVVAVS